MNIIQTKLILDNAWRAMARAVVALCMIALSTMAAGVIAAIVADAISW